MEWIGMLVWAAAAFGIGIWCTAQIRALQDQIQAMRRTLQRREASHESDN